MNNLLKAERHQRAASSQIFPSSLINFYIRRIFFSIISPLSFINTYFSTTTFTLKWNAALLRFLDFKKSLLIKQGKSQSRFGNIYPLFWHFLHNKGKNFHLPQNLPIYVTHLDVIAKSKNFCKKRDIQPGEKQHIFLVWNVEVRQL